MAEPLLCVEDLNAYYGGAHVLEKVSFEVADDQPVALIGRNGMGKTTLCAAIMGISPPHATGSIRFRGKELIGRPSYKIAKLGLGYVPQGRRLFPSLTVDEQRLDPRPRVRALPTPGRATPERRSTALRRRAADARNRPCAAAQSEALDHG